MVIEKFLFPAPNPPHYTLTSHEDNLIWIPSDSDLIEPPKIPCMFYSPRRKARFFLIWSHGNGCDIGSMHRTLNSLSYRLQAHILIFEYPSYGLLQGNTSSPTAESINNHAKCVYSFVRNTLKWPADRIVIYGHSIGSGTACYLASTEQVGALILQSPYTSIKNLLQEKARILTYLFRSPFWDNAEALQRVTCPVLFIHGEQDTLIPPQHSRTLFSSLNHIQNKNIVLLENDDHNTISDGTILSHAQQFLDGIFPVITETMPSVEIDPVCRQAPILDGKSNSNIFSSLIQSSKNISTSISKSFK